jgi:exopolyphosphatase / guanosine-5'-triphosphate,3'-diphosphate pyrophosphatase
MLFASIDIGTNAARLLFSNLHTEDGHTVAKKVSLTRIPLRLGDDVFSNNQIGANKKEEIMKTMMAFKLMIEVFKPVAYIACASAAMREASNSKQIIKQIKDETGIDLQIITGLQEAEIITSADSSNDQQKYKMFVDLGGGSLEISLLENGKIIRSESFHIGALRFLHDKIESREWDHLKNWLKEIEDNFEELFLIGSGGNINKLVKIYSKKEKKFLSLSELKHAQDHLSSYSLQDRIEKLGIRPDRADVIVPSCSIFIKILKWTGAKKIYVPGIGLADGLIYQLYNDYVKNN